MPGTSCDPRNLLAGVHPDLARVLRTAEMLPQPFIIVQGLRTTDSEETACLSGNSQTMHSRHLESSDGLCRAVDVAALINGQLSWAEGNEEAVFGRIARQVLAAAELRGTPLQWGGAAIGAWEPGVPSHFRDWGHFQLPWLQFP